MKFILLMVMLLGPLPPPSTDVIVQNMIRQFKADEQAKRKGLVYYRTKVEEDRNYEQNDTVLNTRTEIIRIENGAELLVEHNGVAVDPPTKPSGRSYDINADIFTQFSFSSVAGRATINGHECYVMPFAPKNPRTAWTGVPTIIASHLAGTIYVDVENFRVRELNAAATTDFGVWAFGHVNTFKLDVIQDDRLGFFVPISINVEDQYSIAGHNSPYEKHMVNYSRFERTDRK